MTVFTNVKKEDVLKLEGFAAEDPKTSYELLRLTKKGLTLILYTSGKLLLQGAEKQVEKLAEDIEKKRFGKRQKADHYRKEEGWYIGSDESLKGDTFGGLVVAAVKADDVLRKKLVELGVADSKKLSEQEVISLAKKIRMIAPCEIKSILPPEYNTFHGSVTEMLNAFHKEVAGYLLPGIHVVDKFPGCNAGTIMEEKAEDKYVEVAAASILARAAALDQLDFLSMEAGFPLPKGSTHVASALQELKEKGLEFSEFVKLHFSNVKEFLKG